MGALSWTYYQDPLVFSDSPGCFCLLYADGSLYAGGQDNGDGVTLWVSEDGGVTWNPVGTDPFGSDAQCLALYYDGTNLWAGGPGGIPGSGSPICYSSDGGSTWNYPDYPGSGPGDDNFAVRCITVAEDGNVLVGGVGSGTGQSVFYSSDGGSTWTNPSPDPFGDAVCSALLSDGDTVIAGASGWTTAGPVATSTDGGVTWNYPETQPFSGTSVYALVLNGSQVVAGGTDSTAHTIAFSTDAGSTWSYPTTDPFPDGGGPCNAAAVNGSQLLAAGLSADSTQSILTSDDGGATWQGSSGPDPFAPSGGASTALAVGTNVNAGGEESPVHALAVSVPVTPVVIPGDFGQHDYEVIVCDKWGIAQGQINSAVPTQVEWDLDDLGQALIDFWILDPSASILPIANIPVVAEVQIWRDQALIWWGIAVSCTFDKDQVHLTCQGHLWILQQLLFGPITTNYLLNPSFELGVGSNWTATGGITATTVETPVLLGAHAGQLAQDTTFADEYLYQTLSASGEPGESVDYQVAAWVWIVPGSWSGQAFQQRGLYMQATDGDTVEAMSFQEITSATPQGIWTRLTTDVTIPAATTWTIEVRLYCPNATVIWDACNLAIPESVSSELDGSDVFDIISLIVDYAQDTTRGKSPLALQPTSGGLTGTVLQRAYQFSDNQGILDALQEFPSIGVADYEIVFDATGHYRWLQVYSNPGKGSTKYNYPIEIDLGNVTDLEGGVDGSQTATAQRVLGQGQTGASAEIGYAVFPSYLGGRVVEDGVFTQGSQTVTSATADFTDADIGLGIYSRHGATQIGSVITAVGSSTSVTMSREAVLSLTDETLGIGGQILDESQSAYPDQLLSTLYGTASAYLTRTLASQPLPTARTRADGPRGLLGVVETGDVVPVMLNYGWLTFGPALMRVAQLILYPPTEELAMGMMVVNAS